MGSAVLTNSVATYVNAAYPTTNLNAKNWVEVRTGGDGDCRGYMFWPRAFPLQASVTSAKIYLYTRAMESATHTLTLQRLSDTFSASKITWNRQRDAVFMSGTKTVTQTGALADGTEWVFDVTDWMQTIANGGAWYGIKITTAEAIGRYVYSENNPDDDYRPRLEVSWSDAPKTPTDLSPSGGRRVGTSKPTVRASYLDVSGSVALQAVQVQINSTDDWTAAAFDSGTVLTSVPELDLSSTAYAGLADGGTAFWRIRFQDGAGLWSPWSDSTSFMYDMPGTLVLSSPSDDLSGTGRLKVEDNTPPVIWTFTGETQAAYQIIIYHFRNGVQTEDWNSGKVTSTDQSITVPSGKINEPSGTVYTLRLRVWDGKQRESVPGFPVYVEQVSLFTYIPGATAPVTNLVATPGDPRPTVDLTWDRDPAPDRFNILRSGKVIAGGLAPEDLLLSSITYGWTDPSPSPQRSLVYSVQAVVNGVASGSNPTATVTVRSQGVWLREPVSGLEVCIVGKADREFTLGESSTALQSIAPNANKVAINQSLGGMEGRIEGDLETVFGRTAQQYRDDLLRLRGMRVKKFWLTVGDNSFQVVAQNFSVTTQQNLGQGPRFRCGFDFYQQDQLEIGVGDSAPPKGFGKAMFGVAPFGGSGDVDASTGTPKQIPPNFVLSDPVVMQCAVREIVTGDWYISHNIPDPAHPDRNSIVIDRFNNAGVLQDSMTITDGGHGTFIYPQHMSDGTVWIWTEIRVWDNTTNTVTSQNLYKLRYRAGTVTATSADVTTVLASDANTSTQAYLDPGTNRIVISVNGRYKLYALDDFTAHGTAAAQIGVTLGPFGGGVQGATVCNNTLYRYDGVDSTYGPPSIPTTISASSFSTGATLYTRDITALMPAGEPESLSIWRNQSGTPVLYLGYSIKQPTRYSGIWQIKSGGA